MAVWSPIGVETLVNDDTAGVQQTTFDSHRAVASDRNGSYVVVWSGSGPGDADGIYARRYDASGPLGATFQVNTTVAGVQTEAAVSMDGAGRVVVVWSSGGQDGGGWGVYAQRYDAAGVAQGSEFRVNDTVAGNQYQPSVAANTAGDFVITWTGENTDAQGLGIAAKRYNAAGVSAGGEFDVNTYTSGDQIHSRVAMADAGNFVVVWQSDYTATSSTGIFAQRFNAAGARVGSYDVVNTTTSSFQRGPAIGMSGAGAYVIAWTSDGQDGSGNGVYAQRFSAAGSAAGGEFPVNTTTAGNQQFPSVAVDNDGTFAIGWQSEAQDGSGWGVYAREYTAAGVSAGGEFRVNTTTAGAQQNITVATVGGGNVVAAWSGAGAGDADGVFLQNYAAGGLRGNYFDNSDFTGPRVSRVDPTINFDWGTGSPSPSIAADTFSVRWTGEIRPQYGETYTFYTKSDDGVRLWVNGALVVENWTLHPVTEDTGTIPLAAGQWYSIVMEVYENLGYAVAQLEWSSASQARQIVPQSRLRPTNTVPQSAGDAYSVPAGGTLAVTAPGVLANDTDADGDSITASLVTGPSHGTLSLNTDGSFTYVPAAGFSGTDTFVYRTSDAIGGSDTAVVTIDVIALPGITVSPTSGLVTGESGSSASFTVVLNSRPTAAVRIDLSTSIAGEGVLSTSSLFFDPSNWNVPQSVTVTGVDDAVDDGDRSYLVVTADAISADPLYDGINAADVSVTNLGLAPTPPPIAADDRYHGRSGTRMHVRNGGVLANDTSPGGLSLTAVLLQAPGHGTFSLASDGRFDYTPAARFVGTDSFTYAVMDSTGHSDVGEVWLVIEASPVDADPVVVPPPVVVPLPRGPDKPSELEESEERKEDRVIIVVRPPTAKPPSTSHWQPPAAASVQGESRARSSSGARREVVPPNPPVPVQVVRRNAFREELGRGGDVEEMDDLGDGLSVAMNGDHPGTVRDVRDDEGDRTPSAFATAARPLVARMDAMAKQMASAEASQGAAIRTVSQIAMAMTAGYVVWSLRGASLLASLLTSIPLWRSLDPLPILESRAAKPLVKKARRKDKRKKDDDEKLGTLIN
jgi:hypothetical protein